MNHSWLPTAGLMRILVTYAASETDKAVHWNIDFSCWYSATLHAAAIHNLRNIKLQR